MYSAQPLRAPLRPESIWWCWTASERSEKASGHPGEERLESREREREVVGWESRAKGEAGRTALQEEVVRLLRDLCTSDLLSTLCQDVRTVPIESIFVFSIFQLQRLCKIPLLCEGFCLSTTNNTATAHFACAVVVVF